MRAEARHLPATYAAIVFKGENLDPDLVTSIIGQPATLQYRKGDTYEANHIPQIRRFGLWVHSTRNRVISDSLKRHLEEIEELLIGAKSSWPDSRLLKIREFVESKDVQLRLDIYWHGAAGSVFPRISKSFEQVVEMAGGTVEKDFHRNSDATEAA